MSDKIIVDLTDNIANIGKPIEFHFDFLPTQGLLPYPNAQLVNVDASLTVTFMKPNVHVCGTLHCFVRGFCDKCLTEIERDIDVLIDQIFYKDIDDGEDGYVYFGSKLDATKAICDEIVLSVPTSLLCKPDCKGLCPKCGANLNEKQCNCDKSHSSAFDALKNLKF